MRFLNCIVIFTLGVVCFFTALAEKAQQPNKITLKLNSSVVADQPPIVTVSLDAKTDFYKGSASLVLSSQSKALAAPIRVFSGDSKAGLGYQSEVILPTLTP